MTAIKFQTFKAFCCIMKHRGGGHELQWSVRLKMRSGPPACRGPLASYHVICAHRLCPHLWRIRLWDGTGTEVAGEEELGSVQLIDGGDGIAIGGHRWCCLCDGVLDTRVSEL